MHSSAQSDCMYMNTWVSICAGSEQLVGVDDWYGLSPVTEGAVLWHDKGLVLLFTQQREYVLHQLTEPAVRGLVALGLLLDQLSLGVDCEDPTHWNSHLLIGKHIISSIPKGGVERLLVMLEQVLDVCKAFNLEDLWFLLNDLPVEGREEAAGRQHERSSRQDGASVVDPLQVTSCHVRHANSPR